IPAGKLANRPLADGGTSVVKEFCNFAGTKRKPLELAAPRIINLRRICPPNPVNPPQHIRLVQLRSWAAEFVPAAGVDHDQAAVGVFEHVGGVEVEAFGYEKILVLRFESAAVRSQDVARDFVHVEQGREEIVPVLLA